MNPFGQINPPIGVNKYAAGLDGLADFFNNILKLMIIGAGLYATINLVLAGYAFMSAGDDSKKVAGAWAKIWQTIMGLMFAAGSFVLAAIFGKLIFNDYTALLQLRIVTP